MTLLYKLTDQNGMTRNQTPWLPIGTVHETDGEGDLCGPGWLHAYTHPLLAVLMNPIHANIQNPRMFVVEADVIKDECLKIGATRMRTVREVNPPVVTTEQAVRFGILCSLEVFRDPGYVKWAEGWLSGADRSRAAAEQGQYAAHAAVWPGVAVSAHPAAAAAAEWAREAAAMVELDAAWSARAAEAAQVARRSAISEAAAASGQAAYADEYTRAINFADLAQKAVESGD